MRVFRGLLRLQTAALRLLGNFLRRMLPAPAPAPCAYVDPRSGAEFPLEPPRWCAETADGRVPLMLTPLRGITRHQIDRSERSIWRYAAAFPLACANPISLGEGCTPLLARRVAGGAVVRFKCEWFNPTCSFKDRGTSVMLSLLRQQGVREVLEDSSGNGGASVAAYAAAGGLVATIMVRAITCSDPLDSLLPLESAHRFMVWSFRDDDEPGHLRRSSHAFTPVPALPPGIVLLLRQGALTHFLGNSSTPCNTWPAEALGHGSSIPDL
jgi:hypothetical protein